ncbi:response regulator transcription factor [Halocynthiibacter namhaensis]|uniref:response regulator transcription factor n=1 Tax=Halocynthiibacter namhaensis TaxID=1290553 RepID=UPI0006901417|nr:response regulator [Halocynthiibacter namhaensis]
MNKPLLLIEDSPSLQLTYEAALNKAGYHVQSCEAGTEGLAKFDELRPQIVLLDLMSPDRRGIEFMREI